MSDLPERPWLERNRRPDDVSDDTVAAVGKFSEALEWVERARGHLYEFHQMMGHADGLIGDSVEELQAAGHADHADQIETNLVGRNAIEGRWSFQIIEEYDAIYWSAVREAAEKLRSDLVGGRHHILESEMKEQRRTPGARFHEQRPTDVEE